jgi:hypothetical protein
MHYEAAAAKSGLAHNTSVKVLRSIALMEKSYKIWLAEPCAREIYMKILSHPFFQKIV